MRQIYFTLFDFEKDMKDFQPYMVYNLLFSNVVAKPNTSDQKRIFEVGGCWCKKNVIIYKYIVTLF